MYKQNHLLGILLSCAGYTAWVAGDTLVKLAGNTIPILEILAIDVFVGSIFIILLAAFHGGIRQLRTKRLGFHLWRSVFILAATYGSFAGIIHLTLADFYTIIFTSPLILTILGSLFLKEKADRSICLAMLFGFLGVIIAVQFSNLSGHALSWTGVLATMLASFALALSMLTARGAGAENNYSLTFWPQVIGCLVSLFIMLASGNVVFNITGIIYCIIAGIMGALGLILTNASLRVAPVAIVSPYHYTQIIGGAIVGYLIWHNVPALSVVIGAAMIIGSGLYILHVEHARASQNKKEELTQIVDSIPI